MMIQLLRHNLQYNGLLDAAGAGGNDGGEDIADLSAVPTRTPLSANAACATHGGACTSAPKRSFPKTKPVHVLELDWTRCDLNQLRAEDFRVVICADLIFPSNESCWTYLADVIAALLNGPTTGEPIEGVASRIAWMAVERREDADRVIYRFFHELLYEERGVRYERVGLDATPSDIFIFQLGAA
jgi:hypothetical protein